MGFSRQDYWSGLPCPPPGDLPDPGIEPSYVARVSSVPSNECIVIQFSLRSSGNCGKGHYGSVQAVFSS